MLDAKELFLISEEEIDKRLSLKSNLNQCSLEERNFIQKCKIHMLKKVMRIQALFIDFLQQRRKKHLFQK